MTKTSGFRRGSFRRGAKNNLRSSATASQNLSERFEFLWYCDLILSLSQLLKYFAYDCARLKFYKRAPSHSEESFIEDLCSADSLRDTLKRTSPLPLSVFGYVGPLPVFGYVRRTLEEALLPVIKYEWRRINVSSKDPRFSCPYRRGNKRMYTGDAGLQPQILDHKEIHEVPALKTTRRQASLVYCGGDAGRSRKRHNTEWHLPDGAPTGDEKKYEALEGGGGRASTEDERRDKAARAIWSSVVKVTTSSGSGSGIVLDPAGYIVTNHHVVLGSGAPYPINDPIRDPIEVRVLEREYSARVVASDPILDIAVLKINGAHNAQLQPIRLASDESLASLRLTQKVMVIGYPDGGRGKTVFVGRICAPPGDKIRIQEGITFGNSGGPVCSDDGMIGMVSSLACNPCPNGIGFAIPLKTVTEVADKMIEADKSQLIKRGKRFNTDHDVEDNDPRKRLRRRHSKS